MDHLTKIVATVGPASLEVELLNQLIDAGVNVFRLNFKHGTVEWHEKAIKQIQSVLRTRHEIVGILLDLQGPEIRLKLNQDSLSVAKSDKYLFDHKAFLKGQADAISLSHPNLIEEIPTDAKIIIDDGLLTFSIKTDHGHRYLVPHHDGIVKHNKTMNVPGATLSLPSLVDKDIEGISLSATYDLEYLALSFVRTKKDLEFTRRVMQRRKSTSMLLAKIECQQAIDHLEEIVQEADAVMVARGDLGVELPYFDVPYHQKNIIDLSLRYAKPVITATQMLETMIEKPFASRAEVSDIANAVFDRTDAVMLSGETAFGSYPVKAVETMRSTVAANEKRFITPQPMKSDQAIKTHEAKVCDMAYQLYIRLIEEGETVAGFVVFTQSGRTARLISRFRPRAPIYAFASTADVRNKLSLSYGVVPFVHRDLTDKTSVQQDQVYDIIRHLKKNEHITSGQHVIVLHGDVWAEEGGTSTVKLVTV